MLSRATLELLERMQDISHSAYPEGGLLYTYTEAANQAHTAMPDAAQRSLSDTQSRDLARFLQCAHGNYGIEEVSEDFVNKSRELVYVLMSDLRFDEINVVFENCGTDMEASLSMARRSDNRYFSLWLWWSVD
jgi:hypothetical protein